MCSSEKDNTEWDICDHRPSKKMYTLIQQMGSIDIY